MAAPTVRAFETGQLGTCTIPAATQAGDLLLAVVPCLGTGTPAVGAPGWTQRLAQTNSAANEHLFVLTKTAVDGDAGTPVTFEGTSVSYSAILALAGAVGIEQAVGGQGSGTSIDAPQITTGSADDLIINVFQTSDKTTAPVGPATVVTSWAASNTDARAVISQRPQATAGPTTTATATDSVFVYWTTATIAVASVLAPNAPSLVSPQDGATVDRSITQRLAWEYSAAVQGDSQSAFDLQWSADAGTTWNTISGTTPNNYTDVAGGTFPAGQIQWQVRCYGSTGAVGPYSPMRFFTAADLPAGPTITDPTSGASIGTATYTVRFSYPTLTSYRYRVELSDGTVLIPLTTVTDPTSRAFTITGLPNGETVTIYLAVLSGGLWSVDVASVNPVSYTPPPTPSVTVLAGWPNPAALTYQVSTPAPAAGDPPATSVTVAARPVGGTDPEWRRSGKPTNGLVTFWTPASGVDYEVMVTAHADNGTTSTTGWVAATAGSPEDESPFLPGGTPSAPEGALL